MKCGERSNATQDISEGLSFVAFPSCDFVPFVVKASEFDLSPEAAAFRLFSSKVGSYIGPARNSLSVKIRLSTCLFLLTVFLTVPLWARSHRRPAKEKNPSDPGYVFALAAANHFLHAWQTGDVETGTVLLSNGLRHTQSVSRTRQTEPSRSRAVMDIKGSMVSQSCWSRFEAPM
jgi:hypothetical protein